MKISWMIPMVMTGILASCGSYQMSTPVTSQQEVAQMAGYQKLSGRPGLRVPTTIGVFHTNRTEPLDFADVAKGGVRSPNIRAIYPIQAFSNSSGYYQLSDVMAQRAKLIQDTRYLGLDVILVCDQQTERNRDLSLVQILTLGIVDVSVKKQNTQLTVVAMDARTGYVYGVMGQEKDGHSARVALVGSEMLADPKQSHVVNTAREDAVRQFPGFWDQIAAKYRKKN